MDQNIQTSQRQAWGGTETGTSAPAVTLFRQRPKERKNAETFGRVQFAGTFSHFSDYSAGGRREEIRHQFT